MDGLWGPVQFPSRVQMSDKMREAYSCKTGPQALRITLIMLQYALYLLPFPLMPISADGRIQ